MRVRARGSAFVLAVIVAAVAAGCSCARSFVVPPDAGGEGGVDGGGVDGGGADGAGEDGGWGEDAWVSGDAGADAFDGDAGNCEEVAGYRRCDECALPCPRWRYCNRSLGLCMDREPDGTDEACYIIRADRQYPSGGCPGGEPCAVGRGPGSGSGTPGDPFIGLCIGPDRPADFCRRGAEAGQFVCLYETGAEYRDGPPTTPACTTLTRRTASCGGVCPDVDCPSIPFADGDPWARVEAGCGGLSEARSFGLCTLSAGDDSCLGYAERFEGRYRAACEAAFGEPCACMALLDAPVQPWTYMVEAEACRRYARLFPDSIRCLRSDGTPL
jgi:hypothetical protein